MKDQYCQCFSNVWDALEDTPQDAAHMRLRTELMYTLCKAIQLSNIPQRKVASRLGITEIQLNDLLKGKIYNFTLDALIHLDARVSLLHLY
ncbi:helix-turn-helix domain-containing protein [Pseudomonas atagonensis]|uniref:helix-turn-helix domain-containing protein n=1 Tax=Pseudomonas atagonensis TaxID=2609964 RepID=UPI0014097AB4|nr:XRE family transcriptional regulator [Pseudomonas atagonensis]